MAGAPTKDDYARVIGRIAIEWNYLERLLHIIIFAYMKEDSEIVSRILGEFGNATKTDLAKLLITKFERDKKLRDHLLHFVKVYNIFRENRNIAQHSVPLIDSDGIYAGEMHKTARSGVPQQFGATYDKLNEALDSILNHMAWARLLYTAIHDDEDGKIRDAITSLEKPPQPHKIDPLPPPKDPPDEIPPPQSSRR